MRNIEIFVRLIIIAACVYVSIQAAVDFYSTSKEFADMPPYPLTPHDPMPSDYRKAMWIAFGVHCAASMVAICAAGEHALKIWVASLIPFHAIPGLFLFVLSLSLLGILGGAVLIAANWITLLTMIGALVGSAALGFVLALLIEEDSSDRKVRRDREFSEARFRK